MLAKNKKSQAVESGEVILKGLDSERNANGSFLSRQVVIFTTSTDFSSQYFEKLKKNFSVSQSAPKRFSQLARKTLCATRCADSARRDSMILQRCPSILGRRKRKNRRIAPVFRRKKIFRAFALFERSAHRFSPASLLLSPRAIVSRLPFAFFSGRGRAKAESMRVFFGVGRVKGAGGLGSRAAHWLLLRWQIAPRAAGLGGPHPAKAPGRPGRAKRFARRTDRAFGGMAPKRRLGAPSWLLARALEFC